MRTVIGLIEMLWTITGRFPFHNAQTQLPTIEETSSQRIGGG